MQSGTARLALLLAVTCGLLRAEPLLFPALLWGEDQWISIRLTNETGELKSVRVGVYRKSGRAVALKPLYEIAPHATEEIRVGGQSSPDVGEESWAWASVEPLEPESDGLMVRTTVEVLRGDEILTFPVAAQKPKAGFHWAQRTAFASGRQFYFLNASDQKVVLTLCATNDDRQMECGKRDRLLLQKDVGARETLVLRFGKLPKRYLTVQSVPSGGALLGFLKAQRGDRHRFSSDSSIQYDAGGK